MSNLLQELEDWFKGRPKWLQDATRRLLEYGEIEESDYNELVNICGTEAGVDFEGEAVTATVIPTGSFTPNEKVHTVKLCSISNVVGINALSPKKPLTIPEGLSIIYGQNGSGKSGYTRLLKQICGAKKSETIYPNVFEKQPETQSCTIKYKYDGDEYDLNWNTKEGVNEKLSSIELYDSACGGVYVSDKNELAYEPALLRVFSQLTQTSDIVLSRLELLLKELASAKPLIPDEYSVTKASQWYVEIKHYTKDSEVKSNCTWLDEDQKRLDALNIRLKAPDPAAKAVAIRKEKVHVDKLILGFQSWETKLNSDSCNKYLTSKKGYSVKQLAASKYAKNIFENSPLTGIGEEVWSLLWEQARAYSEQKAYSELKFPNVDVEAVCVLCQQPLDDTAKKRLTDFEGFVTGELESAAKKAKETLDELEAIYKKTPDEELISSFSVAAGLEDDMTKKVLALRESIVQTSIALLNTKVDEEFSTSIDFSVLAELVSLSEAMESSAKQFVEDGKGEQRDLVKQEGLELEAKKWVCQQGQSITNEIILLKKRFKLEQAKKLVNTSVLTRKKSSLAEEIVTVEYIQRFQNEIEHLGAGRIKVKLKKTTSGKGRVYFQIKLDDNQHDLALAQILSEGEFRIISLAAFIADVEGHSNKASFIFDDPISSLDQDYEEKVADRLVKLSKSRQVLVFTHRLSLMALLDESSKKHGVSPTTIGISKEAWGTGEPGLPPIHAQKTKAAINTLLSKLPEGRTILEEQGNEPYSWWAKSICSNTRITIEKIIEFDLLADVVQRFRRPITTQGKLHNVAKVTLEDCEYIDQLMTKFSRYEHSQPNEVPVPSPQPDELEADLNLLKNWRDDFNQRK
jgi:energy-coupling factor transporter ATP-binding protein EcfA2